MSCMRSAFKLVLAANHITSRHAHKLRGFPASVALWFELFDVFGVCGCEHIKGRPIFNLLLPVRGGAETEDHLDPVLPVNADRFPRSTCQVRGAAIFRSAA